MDHAGLFRGRVGRVVGAVLWVGIIAYLVFILRRKAPPMTYYPSLGPGPSHGDEIVVCDSLIPTGTRVVLWTEAAGYDGYKPSATTRPSILYGDRTDMLDRQQMELVKQSGWDLALLRAVVTQFVIHYDAAGTSRECFHLLHDQRGLSVHFLLDLDGTIYQTLDLRERAWHATTANGRSIGIEIANRGAVPTPTLLAEWYSRDAGGLRITFPARIGQTGILTPNFVGRPATDHIIRGMVQGQLLYQYDLTEQQYQALIRLTATICRVLPRVKCDYPRDAAGHLITSKLPDDVLSRYCGLLGHYHIQRDKQDPGPALQWDRVVDGAKKLMAQQGGQIQ
jgi:N-acetyl-anhydromuramyl-L-alanine amidase AmpD